jgi:hypothetical protein
VPVTVPCIAGNPCFLQAGHEPGSGVEVFLRFAMEDGVGGSLTWAAQRLDCSEGVGVQVDGPRRTIFVLVRSIAFRLG